MRPPVPPCSAAVSGPILINFPSSEGRGELRPWSDLAVGVAECPKNVARVLMLGFCCNFSVVSSLSSPYCSVVVSGPILIGFPSFKGRDDCRHGQIWPLASKNCRTRSPAWFFLKLFVCRGAYGPPIAPRWYSGQCSAASHRTRGHVGGHHGQVLGRCRRCTQNSLFCFAKPRRNSRRNHL